MRRRGLAREVDQVTTTDAQSRDADTIPSEAWDDFDVSVELPKHRATTRVQSISSSNSSKTDGKSDQYLQQHGCAISDVSGIDSIETEDIAEEDGGGGGITISISL
jgi:hypothetical protein